MTGFGPHLVYDGYGCPPERLTDLPALYHLLDALPERIHLTRIMPPCVFRHVAADEREGLSGFVPVAGSHFSVHTFPNRRCFNLDIFSAGPFDVEDALAAIARTFAPRRVDWRLLDRGLGVPHALEPARPRAGAERRTAIARAMGLEVPR